MLHGGIAHHDGVQNFMGLMPGFGQGVADGRLGQAQEPGRHGHVLGAGEVAVHRRGFDEGADVGQQLAGKTQSKGRTIVNLRANVSEIPLGNIKGEFSLWVRNLTKEANPGNFIDFGPSFGGMVVGYFPEPRTFGVTAGVKF